MEKEPIPKETLLKHLQAKGLLSARTSNCLIRSYYGLHTIEDVTKKSEEEISKIRGMGPASFEELKNFLDSNGYSFQEERQNISNPLSMICENLEKENNDRGNMMRYKKVLIEKSERLIAEYQELVQQEEALDDKITDLLNQLAQIQTKGNEQSGPTK